MWFRNNKHIYSPSSFNVQRLQLTGFPCANHFILPKPYGNKNYASLLVHIHGASPRGLLPSYWHRPKFQGLVEEVMDWGVHVMPLEEAEMRLVVQHLECPLERPRGMGIESEAGKPGVGKWKTLAYCQRDNGSWGSQSKACFWKEREVCSKPE